MEISRKMKIYQEDGFLGLVVDGQRYDIGLPDHYLDTLKRFPEK